MGPDWRLTGTWGSLYLSTLVSGTRDVTVEECLGTMRSQKSFQPKPGSRPEKWFLVDADGETLGRVAARVAKVLRGKNLPTFAPQVHPSTHVIVVNAEKIKVTGNKLAAKRYYSYSGYMGGLHSVVLGDQLQKHPERVITHAVKGMLPKNHLGRAMLRKLKVYKGDKHRHAAQKPEPLDL